MSGLYRSRTADRLWLIEAHCAALDNAWKYAFIKFSTMNVNKKKTLFSWKTFWKYPLHVWHQIWQAVCRNRCNLSLSLQGDRETDKRFLPTELFWSFHDSHVKAKIMIKLFILLECINKVSPPPAHRNISMRSVAVCFGAMRPSPLSELCMVDGEITEREILHNTVWIELHRWEIFEYNVSESN